MGTTTRPPAHTSVLLTPILGYRSSKLVLRRLPALTRGAVSVQLVPCPGGQPRSAHRASWDRDRTPTQHGRAISGPLSRVMRGQPRPLAATGVRRSTPLAAVIAPLPKLIVRVRFSSPAPPRSAW